MHVTLCIYRTDYISYINYKLYQLKIDMELNFKGKRALVTGAGKGKHENIVRTFEI